MLLVLLSHSIFADDNQVHCHLSASDLGIGNMKSADVVLFYTESSQFGIFESFRTKSSILTQLKLTYTTKSNRFKQFKSINPNSTVLSDLITSLGNRSGVLKTVALYPTTENRMTINLSQKLKNFSMKYPSDLRTTMSVRFLDDGQIVDIDFSECTDTGLKQIPKSIKDTAIGR